MVTERVVKRWFYNGKGYASRVSAYRAQAKCILKELVLGDDYPPFESQAEVRQWYDKKFSEFFPHDSYNNPKALATGCLCDKESLKADYNDQCSRYDESDTEGDFLFDSCKYAQSVWIKKKVAELMSAEAAPSADAPVDRDTDPNEQTETNQGGE